ncbi:FMN-binding protein [Pseudomaricurvus sp.]|uniref:FMN-binding protein n=1 Tax=Pseudomaricurvus sp. TaxID=2004510 RepID=UPI003F6B319B
MKIRQLVTFWAGCLSLLGCFWVMDAHAQKGRYVSLDELRQQAFPDQAVEWQTLWVTQPQREVMEDILGRSFRSLRVRYWGHEQRTVWIFEEVGKEMPITFGVIVDGEQIDDVVVMEYRESRGGEVRHPFFTRQFQQLELTDEQPPSLDGHIDGITGATLSVRAMTKIATLALFCHQLTPFSAGPGPSTVHEDIKQQASAP